MVLGKNPSLDAGSMLQHGDTTSDPTVIPTASSRTEFLTGLPKHYLTCVFPGTDSEESLFVCKVSRSTHKEEKGLIFAILVFTIPSESSIGASSFPRGGRDIGLAKGRL